MSRAMNALDLNSGRLHSLAVPLALGVFVIGSTATLFRPAFTIGAPVTIVAAPAKPPANDVADARPALRNDAFDDRPLCRRRIVSASEEVARMVTRGKALIDAGDFAAARLLLERAAEAGNAEATFALASTYDPDILGEKGARGT